MIVLREAAGFLTMEEYVRRRQNTVTQYIDKWSLLDLCEGLERSPGERVGMRWRKQEGIELAGAQEAAAAAAAEEEEGEYRKTLGMGQQQRKYNVEKLTN